VDWKKGKKGMESGVLMIDVSECVSKSEKYERYENEEVREAYIKCEQLRYVLPKEKYDLLEKAEVESVLVYEEIKNEMEGAYSRYGWEMKPIQASNQ
jgi:hypothetical protein